MTSTKPTLATSSAIAWELAFIHYESVKGDKIVPEVSIYWHMHNIIIATTN